MVEEVLETAINHAESSRQYEPDPELELVDRLLEVTRLGKLPDK